MAVPLEVPVTFANIIFFAVLAGVVLASSAILVRQYLRGDLLERRRDEARPTQLSPDARRRRSRAA